MARYRLDGACVVGEGYPPMLMNPKPNAKTPVVIVPGPRERGGILALHRAIEVHRRRAEVAAGVGVHRSTVHRWMGRYLSEQLAGLVDRSHRPHSSPAQVEDAAKNGGCALLNVELDRKPGEEAPRVTIRSVQPFESLSKRTRLQLEVEILKKAAAYFAKESR